MPARIPQRRHAEVAANPETRNPNPIVVRSVRCAPLEIIVPWLCHGRKKLLAPPLFVCLSIHMSVTRW